MLKIHTDALPALFAKIAEDKELYLPIRSGGKVNFAPCKQDASVDLEQLKTVRSAKDFFFPQTENIAAFRTQGKEISVVDCRDPLSAFVVFGVRSCDASSLDVLDNVFLSDPVDSFYAQRREHGIVVTLACSAPEESCLCTTFGVDATQPHGDVSTWVVGDLLYWDPQTPKGQLLTDEVKELLQHADSTDQKAIDQQNSAMREMLAKLPLGQLDLTAFTPEDLNALFDSPQWAELSQGCLACGTCTFVCPTCQCYDIRDYDTGQQVQRFRCWDSCMFSDFTMMAHGNPRTDQIQRFRQRYMHKLVYHPANNGGQYGCVGCGRCVEKCPIAMHIAKVIRALGGRTHEQQ